VKGLDREQVMAFDMYVQAQLSAERQELTSFPDVAGNKME